MINRQKLRTIREDIDSALEAVAKKHGIVLQAGNATFNSDNFTMKIEGSTVASDGTIQSAAVTNFNSFARLYGLEKSDFGKQFTQGGKTFEIVGLKTKAKKYPILAKCLEDGKTYKFPANQVKFYLGGAA